MGPPNDILMYRYRRLMNYTGPWFLTWSSVKNIDRVCHFMCIVPIPRHLHSKELRIMNIRNDDHIKGYNILRINNIEFILLLVNKSKNSWWYIVRMFDFCVTKYVYNYKKTNRSFSSSWFVTVLSTSLFVGVDKDKPTSRGFLQGIATFHCFLSELFGYLRRCKNDILFNATHNCYFYCLE